jgi:hypothetical protein
MAQISAPVRIVALVGMLAALAMGGWVMTAGMRGTSPSGAADTPTPLIAQANAVANKLSAHNNATAAGKADPAAATAAKPKAVTPAKHKPKTVAAAPPAAKAAQPAAVTPPATHVAAAAPALLPGTPHTIAALLATHRVVVVLLYNPRAKIDEFTLGEAVLGANQSSAGFLRVDVLDQRQAEPFLKAYGVLQDPTLLFFVRPGKLAHKLTGFADHETISQAVMNAALGIGVAS